MAAITQMQTEFRRAKLPEETRSLLLFDRKAFSIYPADWFEASDWQRCEPWWMTVNKKKIGCCAFQRDADFEDDIREQAGNPALPGSLYVVSTGILPAFWGRGFGRLLKCWQIAFARNQGFGRIVTNTRQSNKRMIALNQSFGFTLVRTTPGYYERPSEATVVMERVLT